ncbi:MAG: hypothetical protein QOJ99_2054 [Bryobacterales bacterium]|nr:hypothetical protein [Bryobacterales bacterium]
MLGAGALENFLYIEFTTLTTVERSEALADLCAQPAEFVHVQKQFFANLVLGCLREACNLRYCLLQNVRHIEAIIPYRAFSGRPGLQPSRSIAPARPSPVVLSLRVTIVAAVRIVLLAGGTRSRVPPSGGAMLTLLRVPLFPVSSPQSFPRPGFAVAMLTFLRLRFSRWCSRQNSIGEAHALSFSTHPFHVDRRACCECRLIDEQKNV